MFNKLILSLKSIKIDKKVLLDNIKTNIKARWILLLVILVLNSLYCISIRESSYMADETLINYLLITNILIIISGLFSDVVLHRFVELFITSLYCYMFVDSYSVGLLVKLKNVTPIFYNILLYSLILFIIYIITKKLILSACINQCFWTIVGYASFFLKKVRGNPLFLSDLASLQTAYQVSGEYSVILTVWIVIEILLLFTIPILLYITLRKNEIVRKLFTAKIRGLALVISLVIIGLFYNESNLTSSGLQLSWWDHKQSTGFLVNTVLEAENYGVSKQSDYSIDKINKIKQDNSVTQITNNDKPDIICIMNESFSDLSVVGDFETNENPLEYFNSLKNDDNCISGNLYVSVKGGNTANSEFEFLTGSTTAIFNYGMIPYNTYINDNIKTNVSYFEKAGYSTLAFHPWKKVGWSREKVYKFMGFDNMKFWEDLEQSSIEYARSFPTDSYDFKKLIEYYNNMPNQPRFILNVTMQNHGGYDKKDFESNIKILNDNRQYPRAEQYLSSIDKTDDALKELIDYYKKVDRKVIICMFGDHQPGIENSFFNKLYGGSTDDLTQEDEEKQYITPFIIWANYDIPHEHIDKMSANYLLSYVTKVAGLKLSPYQNYLLNLYKKYPVISGVGAVSSDDMYYPPETMKEEPEIKEYFNLIYNQIIDTKNTVANLFD